MPSVILHTREKKTNGAKHPNPRSSLPPIVAMREMVWIEKERFRGWGCSECGWVFNPSGAPTGKSFDESLRNFELQRDKEFTGHVCAEHPKTKRKER
jgi:hypothetical protein